MSDKKKVEEMKINKEDAEDQDESGEDEYADPGITPGELSSNSQGEHIISNSDIPSQMSGLKTDSDPTSKDDSGLSSENFQSKVHEII